MVDKTVAREVIFFVLIFLLFYLGCKAVSFWRSNKIVNFDVATLIVGAVITLIVIAIFYLAKMNQESNDGYKPFEISPGALCRGGPYMWQGDSERAKMCRKLAASPAGRCELSRFNCPNGYNGMPSVPLDFTSNSNSCWKGVDCDEKQKTGNCNCSQSCSMQVS